MNRAYSSRWSSGLNRALHQTLLRRIPPKKDSPHLKDLVNALMEVMAKGDFYLLMNDVPPPIELKEEGWPESHYKALLGSGWLEGDKAPMVLEGSQLSWRRWHTETDEIVSSLLFRSKSSSRFPIRTSHNSSPPSYREGNEEQNAAIDAVTKESVILLSGGPGTGKTTTIAKILERAITFSPEIKIALAAPTGKAARRMQDALQIETFKSLRARQDLEEKRFLCVTLHKLLLAGSGGFGRNKQNPLNLDLLVVDEMSMVDLTLMQALLESLPEKCQLVLVGDANQLPPVGSCAIWHQLQKSDLRKQFGGGAIHLHRVYRNRGSLASLSNVLRDRGLDSFWQELFSLSTNENVELHQYPINKIPKVLVSLLRPHFQKLESLCESTLEKIAEDFHTFSALDPVLEDFFDSLFTHLDQLMVLCPRRRGLLGVNYVNKILLGKAFGEGITSWPEGTPVMCGENQPEFDLANGDIGLVLGKGVNRRILFRVISSEGDTVFRLINPVRIMLLEPALALTVHKAQGSEADQVIILWPDNYYVLPGKSSQVERSHMNDVKMIYTALTRAKKRVDLIIPTSQ